MISILVPVFNREVAPLVSQLSRQLDSGGEIIVMDDGSQEHFRNHNQPVAQLPFVRYETGNHNLGRIKIREKLAAAASFDWLLFLDCDSVIQSDLYIQHYLPHCSSPDTVTIGGRVYSRDAPSDCRLRLHWKYGSARETANNPRQGFLSNNFLVHKSIFSKLAFTENWSGYGHEDTWMGIQLERMGVNVQYIDNPLLHDGLETADTFITKSKNALQNLQVLAALVDPGILKRHVKLYRMYCRLKGWGLLWVPGFINFFLQKYITRNLSSCSPSLLLFDLYRLNCFIQLQKR